MNWQESDAVLFDLDGVLTPTADVHMHAWEQMFTDFLSARGERPYETGDYFAYIDGKPRYDGVRSFLQSRSIDLPEGEPSDAVDRETVCGLGNRKDELFSVILAEEGVEPYPGSVRYLDELAERRTKVAVVSSSRNAPAVLAAAGIADRFEVVVDGRVAAEQHLHGKPSPETFQFAARQLGSDSAHSVVVEDALSGVAAGKDGAFGLVIGVDRGAGADALRDAGADIVVSDLGELIQ
ncbi:HAD family hydrolase [Solicola gregarius]|uniref:Beta-phosphoglucomutase n=1 Tax=Solicola gregarius TaxID=2908642 RepID=A0AA46TNE5_9ACTN|nr:beta-phosphoglucomutase family hydrolase [Solicola gregarius]UYM07568.1 beta-phosphoglucomutase family hydrolase [Solicola gregarius]